uniref:E3 ubiquitin/ISG15 ligase TRIM25-like n=1 Tax=Myxine glutinosa TaxID=7769 RepID=UPI00358F08AA
MASSSSDIGVILNELTCPVCFDLYKEPVGLPCGHSFCRVCIEKSWENREEDTGCVCPNCREVFPQKPKLKKNVIIANLVENMKLKKGKFGLEVRDIEHGDVNVKEGMKSGGSESFCEVCSREAAKRCVPCEILCCEKHLKPHQHKGHKLVDPGVKIEELRCIEHGKPIQLYCKDDGSLMCLTCTGGQHRDHNVVALEIAHAELKVPSTQGVVPSASIYIILCRMFLFNPPPVHDSSLLLFLYSVQGVLAAKYPHVSQSMESVASQLWHVQEEKAQTENSSRNAEDRLEEKRRLVCQFVNESVDLMKSEINKRKMEKLSLLGKQREKLEQQMEDLRQGKSTMDTAFQDLEAVSFLQGSNDLLKRLETMSDFKSVKRTPLPVLDFSKEEKNLDELITLNKNVLEKIQKGPVEHPEKVDLDQNNLRRLYGRSPSLDPNSAHPEIKISGDLRTATRTWTENQYPEHPDRFDYCPQVVSRDCFSSGRHYWEVDVRSNRSCDIGICLNSMRRKGEESVLGDNPESWCLHQCGNKYSADHNQQYTDLSVPGDHERVGFFLDCEAGELTCFGDSRVLHVFRGNFMDPVKPAIRYEDDVDVHKTPWYLLVLVQVSGRTRNDFAVDLSRFVGIKSSPCSWSSSLVHDMEAKHLWLFDT